MTDWRARLREAIAAEEDERLSADDALRMRAAVLAEVKQDPREIRTFSWMRPVALAATVVAMIAVGIVAGRRLDRPADIDAAIGDADIAGSAANGSSGETTAPGSSRQLQFSTPGGTRIIWVFNSELDLKATRR